LIDGEQVENKPVFNQLILTYFHVVSSIGVIKEYILCQKMYWMLLTACD